MLSQPVRGLPTGSGKPLNSSRPDRTGRSEEIHGIFLRRAARTRATFAPTSYNVHSDPRSSSVLGSRSPPWITNLTLPPTWSPSGDPHSCVKRSE